MEHWYAIKKLAELRQNEIIHEVEQNRIVFAVKGKSKYIAKSIDKNKGR